MLDAHSVNRVGNARLRAALDDILIGNHPCANVINLSQELFLDGVSDEGRGFPGHQHINGSGKFLSFPPFRIFAGQKKGVGKNNCLTFSCAVPGNEGNLFMSSRRLEKLQMLWIKLTPEFTLIWKVGEDFIPLLVLYRLLDIR